MRQSLRSPGSLCYREGVLNCSVRSLTNWTIWEHIALAKRLKMWGKIQTFFYVRQHINKLHSFENQLCYTLNARFMWLLQAGFAWADSKNYCHSFFWGEMIIIASLFILYEWMNEWCKFCIAFSKDISLITSEFKLAQSSNWSNGRIELCPVPSKWSITSLSMIKYWRMSCVSVFEWNQS
jgi:hypothetical protein